MNRKAAFIAFALVALMASAHVATADEDPTMNDMDDVRTYILNHGKKLDLFEKKHFFGKKNETKNETDMMGRRLKGFWHFGKKNETEKHGRRRRYAA